MENGKQTKKTKQNENGICTLRAAVSQPILLLLLLPHSFVSERLREKLQLCSCSVLHKSHWGKFMVDRCLRKWGLFPLFHRLLTQGRGFAVTDSDPELTSPCVATETEELRKREEARRWGVTTRWSEEREERSGVCLFMYNCLCLPLCQCCCLSSRHRHLWHTLTHSDTHTHRNTCCCCCLLLHLSLKPMLFTTSDLAVCSQLHQSQGDLSSDTAGFLQDGGWEVKHGLLADFEPLHN